MWRLKSCPRCEGDVFIDRSHSGWYEYFCLQCGYQVESNVPGEVRGHAAKYHKAPARTRLFVKMAE